MSRAYDNWERLVGATFKREELRQIALCPSFSTSMASDYSFDSSFRYVSDPSRLTDPSYRDVRPMAFKEIEKATRNFRNDLYLGEGAFGIVYKGWISEDTLTAAKRFMRTLSISGIAVAIKKWKPDQSLGSETWLTELKYLSQLDHPNVIKVIGYCSEGHNLVLVYELMRKGSFRNHLITRGHETISWDTRIKVALGAARGLSFLHDREMPIIHRNINVQNILVDAEFNVKLAGFCFAKDGPVDDTSHISTRVIGTSGFFAPEYLTTGHLTAKCDVYAFGAVLLQILSGLDHVDLMMVKPHINGEIELSEIMDTKLNGRYPHNAARAVLSLAFRCLNSDPKLRPRMDEVLAALQQL